MSNKVALDAEHYVKAVRVGVGPMIPDYVKSYFDMTVPPKMATKRPNLVHRDKRAGVRLVDDSPIHMARKGNDSVWCS